MRELNVILADCRVAFSQMSESEKANAAQTLVGKNAMSGFLALTLSKQSYHKNVCNRFSICKSCSMCELHMELFYFITVFTELFKGNSIFICNLVSITLSVRFFVAYLK